MVVLLVNDCVYYGPKLMIVLNLNSYMGPISGGEFICTIKNRKSDFARASLVSACFWWLLLFSSRS